MKLPTILDPSRWFARNGETANDDGTPTPAQGGPATLPIVRRWLCGKLATVLGVTPEKVDPHRTFTEYGLDSMQAVRLSGDLETWAGRELSPLLLYDYPSVETLAEYLANALAAPAPASAGETATSSVPS